MKTKLFVFAVLLCAYNALAYRTFCTKRAVLSKKPAYEFSVKMLQRITEDMDSHFVYSPISTWLQLAALAEGADGTTFREMWNVTRHHRNRCVKKVMRTILNKLEHDLAYESKRRNVIAIDSLMGVKKSYLRAVQNLYKTKVILLDFSQPENAALHVNRAIEEGTGGVIDHVIEPESFDSTVLVMSDGSYFRTEWKTPFNSAYTQVQPFYSDKGHIVGNVSMMNQIGYFNLTECPHLDARVLEIPCATPRISVLIFLPTNQEWIRELFYKLQRTRLTSIFNKYKRGKVQLVNVTLPKFVIKSDIDNLHELVYDMGIKRIFSPDLAEFRAVSKYKIYASSMTQSSRIEFDERGVTAEASADFLVHNNTSAEFLVNKPFAFMVVDRETELILFAGVYSKPKPYRNNV